MPLNIEQSLYRLQTWFSPSFPVGAYTYSHGLEYACEAGLITNVNQAVDWIEDIISTGAGFSDAGFVCQSYREVTRKSPERLRTIVEYATAFCATRELRLESQSQGAAFIEIIQNVEPNSGLNKLVQTWPGPYPYSIALGCAAGGLEIGESLTINAFLHAFVANLSSALVRIIPLGQTDGQRIISGLSKSVALSACRAQKTELEDIATSTMMVDLASMKHESQYTRLFRS